MKIPAPRGFPIPHILHIQLCVLPCFAPCSRGGTTLPDRGPCSSEDSATSPLAPQVVHGSTVETSFSVPSAVKWNNLLNSSPVRGSWTFPSSWGALKTCYRDLGPVCHEAAMPVWGICCTLPFITSHFYVLLPLFFWLLEFSIISFCSLPSRKIWCPAFFPSLACRDAE